MGGGGWDTNTYTSSRATRAATGVKDFSYTEEADRTQKVNDALRANRINDKILGKLESRDSAEHPESTPILLTLDVTGSNAKRARIAQQALPALMEQLMSYVSDPQVSIAANDDFYTSQGNCIQVAEFESDNRVDEWIRLLWLISRGGSNNIESYDLLLYLAARKMVLDSVEKRGKKGYMFMYMDERIPEVVQASHVSATFGDPIQADIPIRSMIAEARQNFDIWAISPPDSYIPGARAQYVELLGEDRVIDLQNPNRICELVAVTIGLNEKKLSSEQATTNLVKYGMTQTEAVSIVESAAATVVPSSKTKSRRGAARL